MPVGSVDGQYSDICSHLRCLKDINMISCMLGQYQDNIYDIVSLYWIFHDIAVACLTVIQQ